MKNVHQPSGVAGIPVQTSCYHFYHPNVMCFSGVTCSRCRNRCECVWWANKLANKLEDVERELWCWSGVCTDCLSGWFSPQLSQSPPAIWCEAATDVWDFPWVCPSFFPFRSLVSHQHFQSIKRMVLMPNSTKCFLIFRFRVFTDKSNTGLKACCL